MSLVQSLAPHQLGVVVQAYNPRTQEAEGRGTEVQDYPWLHTKLETAIRYIKSYFKKMAPIVSFMVCVFYYTKTTRKIKVYFKKSCQLVVSLYQVLSLVYDLCFDSIQVSQA